MAFCFLILQKQVRSNRITLLFTISSFSFFFIILMLFVFDFILCCFNLYLLSNIIVLFVASVEWIIFNLCTMK